MDEQFRTYLRDVIGNTIYRLGEQLFEGQKVLVARKDALQIKKEYLRELDRLADELSASVVAELEGLGVNSPEDLLAKQDLVKVKLREIQRQMEEELSGK
jgi:RNAse (barnase) inhibitor barstar